ncbi:GH16 beta-1,3-glucan recognition protein [Mycena maculata]|uniref:GH16 beta-1,3-glucan recognition protein n=1 Tax=Mycena maculata TaxID=230809 RepID=A0AAD7I996_9AGAR|nr:GH16 beta-1,3-glucan recognition protein [Mycena maculata]
MARPARLSFSALPPPSFPFSGTNGGSEPPSPTTPLSFLTPPVHSAGMANPFGTPPTSPLKGEGTPFSPPESVRSFSASFSSPSLDTPGAGGMEAGAGYPFPTAGSGNPRTSSLVDIPRAFSTYTIGGGERSSLNRPVAGSALRPASASVSGVGNGNVAGGARRESFASPPARPLTIYAVPSSGARLRPVRPKSTALLVPSTTTLGSATGNSTSNNSIATLPGELGKKGGSARPMLKEKLDKPWVTEPDPRSRLAYWVTYATICLGLVAGAGRIYVGWVSVLLLQGNLCPVMMEDFSAATTDSLFGDNGPFFREVDASGFGNGEFEMTTDSDTNSFVLGNQLYLLPTLTSDVIPEASILNGAIYNLTGCTYNITHSSGYTSSSNISALADGGSGMNSTDGAPDAPFDLDAYLAACSAVSNSTLGTIIPPVMSARISTRKSASMKFGRVEVVAKLPTGDWLWPAIWMLPVGETYGAWPLSGEIDIMEARGNAPSYPYQGINYVRSSLNWGPSPALNEVAKTYGFYKSRRGRYDSGFHTYGLEWSEGFIRMYVDSRLSYMMQIPLNEPFWDRGDFPSVVQNGSENIKLENPWVNGTQAAPFDQSFYLIMNIAVGGTNGWFPDGSGKPWLDGSATAARDFLEGQSQWYPTWPQDTDVLKRAMIIDSVKMWELC